MLLNNPSFLLPTTSLHTPKPAIPLPPLPIITPLARSLDACPLPPSLPLLPPNPPPVSPSPALTWEVRGVGGWMSHSVMMQFHNTQPHLPTDRGTEQEATSGPQQLSSLQSQSSNPQRPNPIPFPTEGAEREERRESRGIERDRRRSLEQTSR